MPTKTRNRMGKQGTPAAWGDDPVGVVTGGSRVSPVSRETPASQGLTGEDRKRVRKFQAYVEPATKERIKRAAYWERVDVGAITERALQVELDKMEKKRGEAYREIPGR